jgi:heme/copper-type cytochrome/quinol oxidase subunit 2
MEFILFYIVPVFCCLILFTFNNYLVKIKKLDYAWKITADIFWFFILIPAVNIITFVFVLYLVIYFLTKDFIEQN